MVLSERVHDLLLKANGNKIRLSAAAASECLLNAGLGLRFVQVPAMMSTVAEGEDGLVHSRDVASAAAGIMCALKKIHARQLVSADDETVQAFKTSRQAEGLVRVSGLDADQFKVKKEIREKRTRNVTLAKDESRRFVLDLVLDLDLDSGCKVRFQRDRYRELMDNPEICSRMPKNIFNLEPIAKISRHKHPERPTAVVVRDAPTVPRQYVLRHVRVISFYRQHNTTYKHSTRHDAAVSCAIEGQACGLPQREGRRHRGVGGEQTRFTRNYYSGVSRSGREATASP